MTIQKTISPVDGSVYVERELANAASIDATLDRAVKAQHAWRAVSVAERAAICKRFCDAFEKRRDAIALELTWQMGRPIRYAASEVGGTLDRARYMIDAAPEALADVGAEAKENFVRFVRREPLGVVFTGAAWNYPYLIAVNSVIPAIMSGNTVVLKHSAQTPLCAERFAECFVEAGLPEGVFQILHLSHEDTERVAKDSRVAFVAFTGSVAGGHAIQNAIADRFIGAGLELGGCDPAYVRHDANLAHAVENLVDGAFFNSGQSCCGIQRIYVHETLYDGFVAGAIDLTKKYVLGKPTKQASTLGPVVRKSAAEQIRRQIDASLASGAKAAIDAKAFEAHALEANGLKASGAGAPYIAPQLLLNVNHGMSVMREEIFGPVAGVMKVRSDDEAIALMNDSTFGLTAAIWTEDADAALAIGDRIDTGTWFMNRCDYLDPALAWVGVKDSGRGCTLSRVGYEHLTRPKSFHLRTRI
jgi:acyl-CoA reductase-like NAD-dependent aldehyde dehydrogenase